MQGLSSVDGNGTFSIYVTKLGFYLQFYSHIFSLHKPNLQGVLNICQIQVAEGDELVFLCKEHAFLMDFTKA